MATRSAPAKQKGGYRIAQPAAPTDCFANQQGVSISLRFFAPNVECFSDWETQDLKRFSALVSKIRALNPLQLKANHNLCKAHIGRSKKSAGFALPRDLSRDTKFHELRVDGGLRIHGVFQGPIFHLVWLDKGHNLF